MNQCSAKKNERNQSRRLFGHLLPTEAVDHSLDPGFNLGSLPNEEETNVKEYAPLFRTLRHSLQHIRKN